MTRFNTGNNLNSLDERDFYDNCLSLDQAMNSTEPTWTDRFNVEKPTIDAALKSAGFMPAGFDFVTGGTLQPGDRNKAVYNPAPNGDNNWYRWNGVFPKEIAANSQPNPKDENNWVPVAIKTGAVAREGLRKTYKELGIDLVTGSFEAGGVLNKVTDGLLHEYTGKVYSYSGELPKTVTPGTIPTNDINYLDRDSLTLQEFHAATYGLKTTNTGMENCKALQLLTAAITAAGGGKVIFPSGIFKVGGQTFAGSTGKKFSYKSEPMFELYNIESVHLHFNNTKFVMEAGLKAGSFHPVTGEVYSPSGNFFNYDYRAECGRVILIQGCKQIVLTGSAEFDGNDSSRIIGGMWGDTGIQIWDTGVYLRGYERLTSDARIYSHDWVTDSLYIAGKWGEQYQTYMKNFTAIRSGRNTFSLCGGSNMLFEQCMFGYQGMSGSKVSSLPASSIDIETEVDKCENLVFLDCQFMDSASGVLCENFSVKGVRFERCKLFSRNEGGYSLYWKCGGADFIDCEIIGCIIAFGPGTNTFQLPQNPRMINCSISNVTHDDVMTIGRPGTLNLINATNAVNIAGNIIRSEFIKTKFRSRISDYSTGTDRALWLNGAILTDCYITIEGSTAKSQQIINFDGAKVTDVYIDNQLDYVGINTLIRPSVTTSSNNKNCRIERTYLSKKLSSVDNLLTMVLDNADFSGGANYGWYIKPGEKYDCFEDTPVEIAISLFKSAQFSYGGISHRYGGGQIIRSTYQLPTTGNYQKGDILFHWDAVPGEPMGWQCTTSGVAGTTAVFKPLANVGS